MQRKQNEFHRHQRMRQTLEGHNKLFISGEHDLHFGCFAQSVGMGIILASAKITHLMLPAQRIIEGLIPMFICRLFVIKAVGNDR